MCWRLPPLLSRKSLVQQSENLGDVELHVFEIQVILSILLHLEQVIQLKIQLEETTVASW